jgi:hypothetical protein
LKLEIPKEFGAVETGYKDVIHNKKESRRTITMKISELAVYEPYYISIFLVLLGLGYWMIIALVVSKFRFTIFGKLFLAISIVIYLLVGVYMVGKGDYIDEKAQDSLIFHKFGFLELIILSYAYIFLGLAVGFGKRKDN